MTKLWKQIAMGAAVVGGVALATYFWMPVRMAAASVMGSGMMESHMKGGNMAAMMESHMKDGKMSDMMDSHHKDGKMSDMMDSHHKDSKMSDMMASHHVDGQMPDMMEMMSGDMMASMDKMHEAMAPMHQKELEAAARVLGMTADDLNKALADGKSADSIAKEKNIDPALVASALVEVRTASFADLVAGGTLTQEQADRMLDHMNKAGSATLSAAAAMQGESCHSHMAPAK